MRISTLQNSNNMLYYMTAAENKYYDLTQQAASGLKVSNPSDDPVAAKSLLNIKEQLSELSTYAANMKTSQNELSTSISALDSLTTLIEKASDYATQAANGTYNEDDLADIKTQIDSMMSTAVGYSNSQFNGNYVFSGTATSTQTYSMTYNADGSLASINYNGTTGDDYQRYSTISEGITVPVNARGNDIFGEYSMTSATTTSVVGATDGITTTKTVDANGLITTTTVKVDGANTTTTVETGSGLFYTMGTLSTALGDNNIETISNCMDELTNDLNTVTSNAAKLAGTSSKMTMTQESIDNTVTNLKSYRSDLRDADLTEVMTDLANAKTALQATYQITSQMLSDTTLLDYL